MTDTLDADTSRLRAWSVRVPKGRAPQFMKGLSEKARAAGVNILVLRGDLVFGSDHLRSALFHAKRAIREGTNSADALEMETLLYASGERQLSTAISKMSVDADTEEVVVALLSEGDLTKDADWRTLEPRPSGASVEALRRFGISDAEISTVSEDRLGDIVLERVAAVDILKR